MSKLQYCVSRAINTVRAAFVFGIDPASRFVACGSGASAAVARGSTLQLGDKVTFGRGCGISVAPAEPGGRAELMIGTKTAFQSGLSLNCGMRIDIGAHCTISWDVHILDNDFHQVIQADGQEPAKSRPIKIGDRVWIGARATVLKGVDIGADSVVAAGSVVTRSFPPKSLIGGNPARLIRTIEGWRP